MRLATSTPHLNTSLSSALLIMGLGVMTASSLVGCASAPKNIAASYVPPGQTDIRVSSLVVRGLDQQDAIDEDELLSGLSTQEDPGWRTWSGISWIPVLGAKPSYFNHVEWKRDKERVLVYCKARGYFNAKLADSKSEDPKNKTIALTLTISVGEPTRVKSYEVVGLEGIKLSKEDGGKQLKPGEVFTQSDYLAAKDALYRRLRQSSYAHARVQGKVVVDPLKREANVAFFVDPGPKTTIHGVMIKGLKEVDRSYVIDAITFKTGQLYSDSALGETQDSIYDLGVFSLVNVQPAFELNQDEEVDEAQSAEQARAKAQQANAKLAKPSAQEVASAGLELGPLGISEALNQAQSEATSRKDLDPKVDVVIQVKEAKPLSVKLGAGFSIDSARQDVHLQANWSSRNLGGTLIKLEHLNTIGYAITPGLLGLALDDEVGAAEQSTWERIQDKIGNRGVIFKSDLELSKPQFIEQALTFFSRGSLEREVQLGYIGLAPSATIGLRRRFFAHLQAELSYSVLYYRYQSLDPEFASQLVNQELIPSGQDTPSQLLETFEQRIIWDKRNNGLNPTRGYRVELALQEASSYIIGGQFDYIKPTLSAEAYLPWRLGVRLVSAIRGRLGSIYNLNAPDGEQTSRGIPVQSRYFAGGRSSMRSFGNRFLSPFTQNTTGRPNDQYDPVPIGGTTLAEWSVEQRAQLVRNLLGIGDLWGAIFLDSATVLEEPLWFDSRGNDAPVAGSARIAETMLYGTGIGLWWLTPIGPLRADFAYTLSDLGRNPNFNDLQVRQKILGYNFFIGIGHSF